MEKTTNNPLRRIQQRLLLDAPTNLQVTTPKFRTLSGRTNSYLKSDFVDQQQFGRVLSFRSIQLQAMLQPIARRQSTACTAFGYWLLMQNNVRGIRMWRKLLSPDLNPAIDHQMHILFLPPITLH